MSEATIEFLAYGLFVLLTLLVIGYWRFFLRRDPVFHWRWHARAVLLIGLIGGGYLVALTGYMSRSWALTGWALAFVVSLVAIFIGLVTVCTSCGRGARVYPLTSSKLHCIFCGTRVGPSPLIAPTMATPPAVAESTEPGH